MNEACWAVIPAAGIGSRMDAAVPKQYLELAGRYVLDHAIERLLLHPMVDGLYLALAPNDRHWCDSEFFDHPDVVTTPGGAARADSVLNALDSLAQRAAADDWVLVHDAARPLVCRKDISRLIVQVAGHRVGGLLAAPARDTMKLAAATGEVTGTPPRDHLWHAYTPQMFRLGALRDAMRAAGSEGVVCTDEAAAMERRGDAPLLIRGRNDNLKITYPEDLELAALLLQRQLREGVC